MLVKYNIKKIVSIILCIIWSLILILMIYSTSDVWDDILSPEVEFGMREIVINLSFILNLLVFSIPLVITIIFKKLCKIRKNKIIRISIIVSLLIMLYPITTISAICFRSYSEETYSYNSKNYFKDLDYFNKALEKSESILSFKNSNRVQIEYFPLNSFNKDEYYLNEFYKKINNSKHDKDIDYKYVIGGSLLEIIKPSFIENINDIQNCKNSNIDIILITPVKIEKNLFKDLTNKGYMIHIISEPK